MVEFFCHEKSTKTTYRIRNWKEYNQTLKQRGSFIVWISDAALENWTTDEKTCQAGRRRLTLTWRLIPCSLSKRSITWLGNKPQAWSPRSLHYCRLTSRCRIIKPFRGGRGALLIALPVKATSGARHLVTDSTG